MISYRITKFDPKKRDSEGIYKDITEWTSISDMGNPDFNNLTFEEYYKTETNYVNAIKFLLADKKISSLKINSLENYNDKSDFDKFLGNNILREIDFDYINDIEILENGQNLQVDCLAKITRLILRELIWMELIDSELEIKFGYDYYMYVKCNRLSDNIIKKIEKTGLFVEPNIG